MKDKIIGALVFFGPLVIAAMGLILMCVDKELGQWLFVGGLIILIFKFWLTGF